jgi:hypothetical protein
LRRQRVIAGKRHHQVFVEQMLEEEPRHFHWRAD